MRVYELSKELGITSKEILNMAKTIGLELKSHASSISESEASKVRELIGKGSVKNNDQPPDETPIEEEKVEIIHSKTGQDVVRRRKGKTIVLRKKKKVLKSETDDVEIPVAEPAEITELKAKEKIKESGIVEELEDVVEPKVETIPEKIKTAESKEIIEEEKVREEVKHETEVVDDTKELIEDKEPEILHKKRDDAVTADSFEEETKIKTKKKTKKVKLRKEEIIDEDTLEELRRAFRTKLPGRKKEYVVDDRKYKNRGNQETFRKHARTGVKNNVNEAHESQTSSEFVEPVKTPTIIAPPIKKEIKIGETITVGELAKKMGVKSGDVIKKLIQLGMPATINQSVDHETAVILAGEYGVEVEVEKYEEDDYLFDLDSDAESKSISRPPVVTVMGHVDHGKTTLLDTIRNTNVVGGEAGGITQHIGAYTVNINNRTIVFVDTPGHEAFTSMRVRGASITDIVILVVAADDGVMPQTVEAVNHAKAAGVPIIVAINKIDKEEADPEKIKRQLSEIELIPEEWGGDVLFAEISAKSGKGINELLELILLQSDVLELKAVKDKRSNGVVLEAKLDKGRGPVSTVIVTEGTLHIGDCIVAGTNYGKVRALNDSTGKRINEAEPSIPVEVMGLSGVPVAGEKYYVVKDEKTAKEIVDRRLIKLRETDKLTESKISLEELFASLDEEKTKELALLVKGDTQGSVEALIDSILKLNSEKCSVKIVHSGVGAINETDIILASASNAIVVGFNVRPDNNALKTSEKEGVSLELHTIIYNVVQRIKDAMEGLLEPILKENITANVEVKEIFNISRIGTIAGCLVTEGKASRDDNVRVIRDGVLIYDGKVASLRRFKEDVKDVQSGYECGISVENYNDIKVGDVLELYNFEEIKQEL